MLKDIIGYEGIYKISSSGYLLSTNKKIYGYPQKSGHIRVTLCRDGIINRKLLHRLVAIHFLKNPMDYPLVRHKDHNPKNNDYTNLEWGTHKHNSQDMVRANRQASGIKNGMYGKVGILCPASILVLNTDNGIFYDSITEAANSINHSRSYLAQKLSGERRNNTSLIKA